MLLLYQEKHECIDNEGKAYHDPFKLDICKLS